MNCMNPLVLLHLPQSTHAALYSVAPFTLLGYPRAFDSIISASVNNVVHTGSFTGVRAYPQDTFLQAE